MKSNRKIRSIILIILGIIFAFSSIFRNISIFIVSERDISSIHKNEFNHENLKISEISAPIYIDDTNPSYNWSVAKEAGICKGFGTQIEPYIIEDLVIDSGGSGSCILIKNSNVYFIIENCILYNSGTYFHDAGIRLSYVINSQLTNNNCSYNSRGIHLEYCINNTVEENIATNNENYGIHCYYSNNTEITKNIVESNYIGIVLDWSHLNNILENEVRYNWMGIWVGAFSNSNLISKNIIMNSTSYAGIEISYSDYNVVRENIFSNNSDSGIYSSVAKNTLITENYFINNEFGILFSNDVKDNIIYKNCFVNNRKLNAWDNGLNNQWNYTSIGNFWDDYDGEDSNNDGIGDSPYDISAIAQALGYSIADGIRDNYPLMKCPISTSQNDGAIPGYSLFLLIAILSIMIFVIGKNERE